MKQNKEKERKLYKGTEKTRKTKDSNKKPEAWDKRNIENASLASPQETTTDHGTQPHLPRGEYPAGEGVPVLCTLVTTTMTGDTHYPHTHYTHKECP